MFGSTKNKITKDKNHKNIPQSEVTEVVLVRCNIANNGYQKYLTVLYKFVANKPFGSPLEIKSYLFKNI